MTIMHRLLTPGDPFYWAMILLPNLAIIFFILWRSLKNRAFLLVGVAALLNLIVPYCQELINDRCNGINAPGIPEWFVWAVATIGANQGTVVLLLAFASLILISRTNTQG